MADLTVIDGGGQAVPDGPCVICGVVCHGDGDCGILARHLAWMEARGRRPNTVYTRGHVIRRLGAAIAPVPVLEATEADIEAWRAGIASRTPKSVLAYCSNIREFYAWSLSEGLRADNPAARLVLPRKPVYLPRPISEDDLMLALDTAPPRVRIWLILAAWAGLRAIEVALLRRESIRESADPPVLIIEPEATKGGRHARVIPLSPFVVAELAAYGLPASGWAFPRRDGGLGPNEAGIVSKLGSRALHKAGLDDTFHSLRHRFGTQCWRVSHDLLVVQHLLGHLDPRTTGTYILLDDKAAAAAVNAIPTPRRPRKLRVIRESGGSA